MKKSTVKAAKTPATAKKAPAKIVKKPAAAPVKRAAAPAVKASSSKASPTVITALIDIGFGNTLYVRGEGPGLNWNVGVPLDCAADDKWSISLPGTGKPVLFKLLINDISWSVGPDYVAASGEKVTVAPNF
jgi:hypothetical protein